MQQAVWLAPGRQDSVSSASESHSGHQDWALAASGLHSECPTSPEAWPGGAVTVGISVSEVGTSHRQGRFHSQAGQSWVPIQATGLRVHPGHHRAKQSDLTFLPVLWKNRLPPPLGTCRILLGQKLGVCMHRPWGRGGVGFVAVVVCTKHPVSQCFPNEHVPRSTGHTAPVQTCSPSLSSRVQAEGAAALGGSPGFAALLPAPPGTPSSH